MLYGLLHLKQNEKKSRTDETIVGVFKSFKFTIISLTLFVHWYIIPKKQSHSKALLTVFLQNFSRIVNNFIFYGVGLKSNDLGANPYMTFAISAAVELIAIVITHQILEKFGRKIPYGLSLLIAGLSCFVIVFIGKIFKTIRTSCVQVSGLVFIRDRRQHDCSCGRGNDRKVFCVIKLCGHLRIFK